MEINESGAILTFYSYKGGVGRTMALANIATLLAEEGYRVLAVDWDLEAPGLHRYFSKFFIKQARTASGGLAHYLAGLYRGNPVELNDYVEVRSIQSPRSDSEIAVSVLQSGEGCEDYPKVVGTFDWHSFFEGHEGGAKLEALRAEFKASYDFTLIDSRTGLTDSGGICTIYLPDVLLTVFTANQQSIEGVLWVTAKSQAARQSLPFDRANLCVVPVLSRWDGQEELEEGEAWMRRIASSFAGNLDWLPSDGSIRAYFEDTHIPQIPYYNFGEKIAVLEDSLNDKLKPSFYLRKLKDICVDLSGHRKLSDGECLSEREALHISRRHSSRRPLITLSSTSLDLPTYRMRVIEICRRLGFETSEMELLNADNAPTASVCKQLVDGADICLGIIGHRYGVIPEGETRSITEMEFDWASAKGIPRLLFVVDPAQPWPVHLIDFRNYSKLQAFKDRISRNTGLTVAIFTSEDHLGMLVAQALGQLQAPSAEAPDIAVRSYVQRLEREAGEIGMFGLGQDIQLVLPISEVYVDLQFQAIHAMGIVEAEGREDFGALGRADRREDLPWDEVMKLTFSRSAKTRKRAVCILGEPGAGKTTVAKKIAWELASGTRSPEDFGLEPDTVPVLLRFRDLRAEEITAAGTNFLRHWVVANTADALGDSPGESLYSRGKVLWILDGLDQVVSGPMRHASLSYLQAAIEARFDKGDRFLITSRFSGVGGEAKLPPVFQEFHVKALPWEQVEIFVKRWFDTAMEALSLGPVVAKEKTAGLLDILGQDEYRVGRLRALCYNPLMLTILCVVFHRNAQLPHSRAELYSHCVDVLLSYWRNGGFDSTKSRALLRLIAWYLHGESDRTHAPRKELAALVEARLKDFSDPRLGANGEEFLSQMRNECGILAGAGGGNLGFLHLTFQEFLASEHALREGKVAFVAERAALKWWRETALLTARQASQTEAETFYRVLLTQDLSDPAVMRMASLCIEESTEFPAAPILEQVTARDEAGRIRLLQLLQSRPRLPDSILDALETVAQEAPARSDLRRLAAGLLTRQGRAVADAVDGGI